MKNKKEIRNLAIFGILVLATLVLLANPVAAVFTDSNPQTSPTTFSTSTFDTAQCTQGQDFIVQISPTGCTPAVVRSDLLEEQDVQVYCPLSATQINPMINIKSINSVSFSGDYSPYVRSIGFYPAQAALNLQGQQNNYPLLSTIGYVVINLKQMPNESSMPDFVMGNLTAKINYNSEKVFGAGTANLYLPEMSDADWEANAAEYGFLNGKGFVRADNIESDKATIKVYDANLNQQGTANLKQGETSGTFSVSGFNFCSGGVQVKLNSIKTADTRVKLDVNGDSVQVSKGEYFLDNSCQIIDAQPQGLARNVQITCSTDSGKKSFSLKIAPQIVLDGLEGGRRTVKLGEYLYTVPGAYNLDNNFNGGKSVFLGYIGSKTESFDAKDLYIVLVALPKNAAETQNGLSNEELASIANWIQSRKPDWKSGTSGFMSALSNVGKTLVGIGQSAFRFVFEGESSMTLTYADGAPQVEPGTVSYNWYNSAKDIKIVGFAEGYDNPLKPDAVKQYYQNATDSYNEVLNTYQSETYPSGEKITLGEQALYNQILLAKNLQQKLTLSTLCDEFMQKYPQSKQDLTSCKDGSLFSSQAPANQYITINGHSYLITLETVSQPTYEDYGAEIQVRYQDGSTKNFQMNKGQTAVINETSGEFMLLGDLTQTTAKVSGNVKAFSTNTAVLKLDEANALDNYVLTLVHVNLKQFAQVSVIPKVNTAGSQANFSFNIGIEKRAIQLSPDKIKEKIAGLNDSIATWESLSNTTGKVIQGLTAACEATGAVLTVKNFFENLGGQGVARQIVMRGNGGWSNSCSDLVNQGKYISTDQCFLDNSKAIDSDVDKLTGIINDQNSGIKDREKDYTTSSTLGGDVVQTDNFMKDYLTNNVQTSLNGVGSIVNPNDKSQSISTADAKTLMNYSNWKNNNFNIADAKNIELYATVLSSSDASPTLKALAQQELYSTLTDIKVNSDKEILQQTFGAETGLGEGNVMVGSFQKQNEVSITSPKTFITSQYYSANPDLSYYNSNYTFGFKNSVDGKSYVIIYGQDGVVKGTYLIGANNQLTAYTIGSGKDTTTALNPFNMIFKQYSEGTYKNTYKDPKVQYFETDPYKGMPAIVPFDTTNGWYAAMKQTLATGNNIQTYDASAKVNSFYLCNVGKNGIQEFNSGLGDDSCQSINVGTNQLYNNFDGLDPNKAASLVKQAVSAIQEATKAYQSGVSYVTINGQRMQVGTPASNVPSIQCQDFMSPGDCNLLFNLCDPVICPPSRCDFGGAYPVTDVAQTGIIGSIALCLPNAREGIVIPVCLTGIQAGMENWISVQKAYRACLQENLNTGKTTGICDEVNSIYMCDFFWQQAAPLANLAIPKITEYLSGQNTRGGGEYMSVQNAFDTTKKSIDYLLNYYAAGSTQAFKLKTLNVGTVFCQNFASLTTPNGAEVLDQLTTPDSPPQFTGNFQEISLTTATVPPTSQYKVFYHIYAGKNAGVYYSVYLQKSTGSSFYQDSSSQLSIDSGYINAGGFADQTIDKSASSGYDQLCINVNGKVECGFHQVSTSLAVNYIQDLAVADEISKNVTTEADCISGSASIYSILNPNIQNAVANVIDPQLYNQGITRVCATGNPGIGSDANADQENSRWVEVGYCGDKKLKCWLDTKNIKDILNSPDLAAYLTNGTTTTIADTTLNNVESNYLSILLGNGDLTEDQFASAIKDIVSKTDPNDRLKGISDILDKIFYNNQKAYLLLLKGDAYGELAVKNLSETPAATTSALHLDNGGPCIADFDCSSGYCDLSGHCADKSTATTASAGSGTSYNPSALTSNNIFDAMTYATSNTVGGKNCNCGTREQCQNYANSIYSSAIHNGEDPLLLLSIMIQESNCMQTKNGQNVQNGNSYGLMQIDSSTISDCVSAGIGNQNDINSNVNNENIQCGALILKNKYSTYGSKQNTFNCATPGKTYSGWDAAVRGYNGYGCTGNNNYVEDVNSIYNALKTYAQSINPSVVVSAAGSTTTQAGTGSSIAASSVTCLTSGADGCHCTSNGNCLSNYCNIGITHANVCTEASAACSDLSKLSPNGCLCIRDDTCASNYCDSLTCQTAVSSSGTSATPSTTTTTSASSPSTGAITSSQIAQFNNYKSLFEKYSQSIQKGFVSISQKDFEALLVAIAVQNNFGADTRGGSDWLMGYNSGETGVQGAEKQISTVAALLMLSLNGAPSSSPYHSCPSGTDLNADLSCALSVLHTGKTNYGGFLGIGANTDGINYANSTLSIWEDWKAYFNSQ